MFELLAGTAGRLSQQSAPFFNSGSLKPLMDEIIIKSVPKAYYWIIWFLFSPVVGAIITAIVIRPLVDFLFHCDLAGTALIATWIALTLVGSAWIAFIDYRYSCYVLGPKTLHVGRGSSMRVIPFDDIESIVIGPPVPRYLIYTLIFLRLTGGRDFTLRVSPWMANGERLVSALLRENHNKVVAPTSYTKNEIESWRFGPFRGLLSKLSGLLNSIKPEKKMKTPDQISNLVRAELARIEDTETKTRILSLLVTPYPSGRGWDYGKPGETFVCWMVLEHRESNVGIAYCDQGFGPKCPWGLLSLEGPHMSMGMDCGWYPTLEGAFLESSASLE